LEINFAPQKGVTKTPTLETTGKFAGDFIAALGDTSDAVTGTAGIEWTPNRDTLAYARYNRGYKAFGLNAGFEGAGAEAKPETVDDFEVGLKQTIGRNFQIAADAFYYNYLDDQIPIGVVNPGTGTILTQFINIPKSVSQGFELTANWTPIDHLNLSLVYGFDDTFIGSKCSLVNGVATGFCPADAVDTKAVALGARPVGGLGLQNVAGDELPQAPKNKIAFNANYTWQFEAGDLTLSGSYVWKDKSFSSIFTRTYYEAPSWNQVDSRITWAGNHDKYEFVLYVRNLFNTLGYDAAAGAYNITQPIGGGASTQAQSFDLTPPRTFGFEVHYKF
jgi:iron complex outermembrane receptor protein